MVTNYRKQSSINCLDSIDKQLHEVKERFQTGDIKNAFSDTFMEYLKNKTLKFGVTGVERQKLIKRMYYKLEQVGKISEELKRYTYPFSLDVPTTTPKATPRVTQDILDGLLKGWEPGNPDYPICTDNFNFGIPKNLTVIHRYLLPVTRQGMFNLKPIVHEILRNYTHIYEPTSQRPRPVPPLVTTTTERLTLSEEVQARYNNEELIKRYGVHMSEFTSSDSESKKKTFIKENNTLIVHDFDCSEFFDPRSGVMRRKKFTRPPDPSNKTTLRLPSKQRRKKYWGPRIYEKLRLLNDSKRVKKILSDYNEFMLNRGSSFNFGHDTMYESQYDSHIS
ncbi:hypothetical protein M8J76_000176 [Diaphorina citri]|nr:hypothetical protein M8J75_003247 [Diaphorina citri]KAI5726297.1 hypothetical protein M8J76_000176 [Diaphorina citri]KAI5731938.1 hypothetical protein M8J77_018671 [Diaphorina citri]